MCRVSGYRDSLFFARWREQRHDAARFKSLAEQITMHAAEDGGVAQRHAMTKAAVERLLEKRCLIDLGEHFGDRVPRNIARNAERFDLPHHARGRDA